MSSEATRFSTTASWIDGGNMEGTERDFPFCMRGFVARIKRGSEIITGI